MAGGKKGGTKVKSGQGQAQERELGGDAGATASGVLERQKCGQHIDESVELGGGLATEHTLLIYLSGGEESSVQGKASRELLVGGETVFTTYAVQHCMLHEARVVAKDVKYMLRSDVMYS
ncbi:hypothetical protein R1sor_002292 [Riccia sorocarpa]|uniref:Uncharacterized protein n=1 Tax=Riccia sorocarpa TaxID=122646 RepID=A0ABD3GYE0_9MARC